MESLYVYLTNEMHPVVVEKFQLFTAHRVPRTRLPLFVQFSRGNDSVVTVLQLCFMRLRLVSGCRW